MYEGRGVGGKRFLRVGPGVERLELSSSSSVVGDGVNDTIALVSPIRAESC